MSKLKKEDKYSELPEQEKQQHEKLQFHHVLCLLIAAAITAAAGIWVGSAIMAGRSDGDAPYAYDEYFTCVARSNHYLTVYENESGAMYLIRLGATEYIPLYNADGTIRIYEEGTAEVVDSRNMS